MNMRFGDVYINHLLNGNGYANDCWPNMEFVRLPAAVPALLTAPPAVWIAEEKRGINQLKISPSFRLWTVLSLIPLAGLGSCRMMATKLGSVAFVSVAKFSSVAGKLVQNDAKEMSCNIQNKITHNRNYSPSAVGTRVRHRKPSENLYITNLHPMTSVISI